MNLRTYIQALIEKNALQVIRGTISTKYEIAALMKRLEPQPVLFESVKESKFSVIGNLFCSKSRFAAAFQMGTADIIPALTRAIENPSEPTKVVEAPCQEVVHGKPDLGTLPILTHFPGDGGPFITSGVVIANHPIHGQNMDFHRFMPFSTTEMALRVVKGRHFHTYLEELGQLDIAICVGNTPNILAAGAISVDLGFDELTIANTLQPFSLVRAKSVDVMIPAESEVVLEGTVYRDRQHAEGPFVDLTGTQDVVRMEPVFEVKTITHRENPIWQALLPGGLEHKLLMGMPREPTIYQAVNRVARCLDVNVNPGGCSWLHAIVQINKQNEDDGRRAIHAAFSGHRSCKHVFVVDHDIDIYDPIQVEWAMATRFQGDRDLVILPKEPGSSLDPSAEPGTKLTTKMGFDLTATVGEARSNFEVVPYPEIDLDGFID